VTPDERPAPEAEPARSRRRLGQVPALDGLRGIAVLLVVLSHTRLLVLAAPTGLGFVDDFFRGGFLGVDVFFVLSGFLITALLLREQADRGHVRIGSFYTGRALRLLPALFVLLAAHVIYAALANPFPFEHELVSVRAGIFYYYNWQVVWDLFKTVPDLGHLWSLAIEEQFYLLWPAVLILFLGIRRKTSWVVVALVAAIVAIAVHRALMWERGASWIFIFVRTDTRADSLLVGVLLAWLWVRRRTPTKGLVAAAWVASGVLFLCVEFSRFDAGFVYLGGFTIVALAVGVVILATLESSWPGTRLLSIPPLRAVGRVSYGLYLWHLPVFYAVDHYGSHWPAIVRVIVGYGASAAFTTLSWFVVETPALRLKRRLSGHRDAMGPESAGDVTRTGATGEIETP
jgi:peptidoglycan/LPS O-acetylase OafA/YrhL